VTERHRYAKPIVFRELQSLADEEAVVENIVMGQCRTLGKAGGAVADAALNLPE
jgi:hypothetical protein